MVCMVGFFNKDDEGGNYGTAEKEGDTSAGNTRTDEQTSKSNQTQERQTADSIVGIDGLMDKRVKLEESINYVGHMIKTLKDKRARLEKDVEEEAVDIKNLREQLIKIREYIDEENKGIENLTKKRSQVD